MISTHELAYRNWMLMEPDESMTKEQLVAGESCAGKKWHNPISYYTNPTKRDVVSGCRLLVAVKNFNNYKNDCKSYYVKLIKYSMPWANECYLWQLYESNLTVGSNTVQMQFEENTI